MSRLGFSRRTATSARFAAAAQASAAPMLTESLVAAEAPGDAQEGGTR